MLYRITSYNVCYTKLLRENGFHMSELPEWLEDFVSIVELKQHQGFTFYINGEASQDSRYIVTSMWKGRSIHALKQKI